MVAELRIRDALKLVSPWWLSDRLEQGKTVGYRYLWGMVSVLDELLEGQIQALQSPWPGKGTPTALPYIGRSRGILRGQADTYDEYAAKLRGWLDRWLAAGSQLAIAREIHDYLSDHPRVRVINRAGHWVTMNADGTVETSDAGWDWDSVSNPERSGFWSELSTGGSGSRVASDRNTISCRYWELENG